ncbi:rRNA-processing protein UTP23 homolog isoform X2 [Dunckerocampus dactyliophorus]|uniref:rRNA-processing protein UTP23 homolog isoform X2 n=2 Tax=Dunckerocampus dactyliophorus TaxID=161453 RepID=UPI002404E14E|nr:rRNA-processing protein UTP23 homolog isoform X2 [Dunckerocampus dactyliophorus]
MLNWALTVLMCHWEEVSHEAALKNKIQIKEQMPKYLMGEVQLCTTNCALKELETLGKELYGAKIILQRYQVRKCPHFKNPVPASECLLSMLEDTNPHHYFIATQDHALTTGLKKIPGVPLLYIILNTMVLDKPSQPSLDHVQAVQLGELVSPSQQQSLRSMKEEQGIVAQKDGARRGTKRKRKQHNPNPLSCLKKKKKKGTPTPPLQKSEPGQKRSRSRHKKRGTEGVGDALAGPSAGPNPPGTQHRDPKTKKGELWRRGGIRRLSAVTGAG